jgi:hypothetical protein
MARKLVVIDEDKLAAVLQADPEARELRSLDVDRVQALLLYDGGVVPAADFVTWGNKMTKLVRPILDGLSPNRRIELIVATKEDDIRFADAAFMARLGWFRLLDAMVAPSSPQEHSPCGSPAL